MFTLSALCEGFARGVVYLHAACPERSAFFAPRVLHRGRRAPLLGREPPSVKSRVSISSKLIEIKGLQLQHFGHLRKTGGRGSYQLTTRHPLFPPHSPLACPPQLQRRRVTRLLLSPLFPLHTNSTLVCLLFPLLTQKRGVGGMSSQNSFLRSRLFRPFTQKCRRAEIFDFSHYFSPFFTARHLPASEGGRYTRTERRQECLRHRSLGAGHCSSPLSLSSHSTPRLLRHPFPKRNLLVSPLFQGARPAGMSPFVYRCPDAHD